MSALPKQVDYHRNIKDGAKYRTLQVPLTNNPSSSLNPVTSASTLLQWKLPSGVVFNLSKSTISYTIAVAAEAAFTVVNDDSFQIAQQLTLQSALGIQVADIPFANRYSKIADKLYTRRENFNTRANVDLSYPSNSLIASNPIEAVEAAIITANTYGLPTATIKSSGFLDYVEPRYFNVSASATAHAVFKIINLGDAGRGTLFSQDKDLYFGMNDMYLNLTTAPVDSIAFQSSSATVISAANSSACTAGAVVVTNIMLNLAVEDNAVLSNSVINKYNSGGIQVRTDYLLPLKNLCNAANSNVTVQIPQQPNAKLKRITTCAYNAGETLNNMFDAHNLNGEKIQTFTTTLDSQLLQNNAIDCRFSTGSFAGNTDYRENAKFLKGGVLQGVPMYQYNFSHTDNFCGDDSLEDTDDINNQNHDSGLDLHVSRNYALAMATPNAAATNLAVYSFCVLSKVLHISNAGVMFA